MADIDEEDILQMESISEEVCGLAKDHFKVDGLEVSAEPIHFLADGQVLEFLELIEFNLDSYYQKHVGKNWIVDKEEEIQEPGLVYVWYRQKEQMVGFMSFKLCMNEGHKVLYLYEIHVHPRFQGKHYGSQWISLLHGFCSVLGGGLLDNVQGTALTVFSSNTRALEWYKRLGYVKTKDSPVDKVLRGKVVRPDVYLLERIQRTNEHRRTSNEVRCE